MHKFFYNTYLFFNKNKALGILFAFVFLIFCSYLGSKIKFDEDVTRIIPKSEQGNITTQVIKQLNFSDKITVLIEKNDSVSLDPALSLAQSFYDTIKTDSIFIDDIQGYIDEDLMDQTYQFVNQNLPLFLDRKDYDQIQLKLTTDSLKKQVEQNFNTLLSPTGFIASKYIQNDPLGITFIGLKKLQSQISGSDFRLVNGFITSADSSKILLFISPNASISDSNINTQFVDFLSKIQNNLNEEYKGKAQINLYGSALVANANAKQIKTDIFTTIIISMSTLMVLLIIFYRRISIPIIIFIPSIFAGVFAIAILSLLKPSISAISLSISAVLVGITIDYALHILTHYKRHTNVQALYKEISKPLIMSASTNAVAFLCLLFVHSEALIDLGIFASIAILGSAIFSLLIIPHIYKPTKQLSNSTYLDKIASYPFEKSKFLIFGCLAIILVSLFTFNKVGYNNDLSALNYMPSDLKEVENKLDNLTHNNAKSIYVVAYGKSFDQVLDSHQKVELLLKQELSKKQIIQFTAPQKAIKSVSNQIEDYNTWNNFWAINKQNVVTTLVTEGKKFGFADEAHATFYNQLHRSITPLNLSDFTSAKALASNDFIVEKDGFFTISTVVKLDESMREQFIKQVEQLENVLAIDRKQLNETYLGQLKNDFNNLIDYSVLAIVFILWLFFRRFEWVLFSMLPILFTGLVTAGLMGLFNLEFNIFSAIVCTLVFGHGVDFSIFMTSALQKEYTTGKNELQTYRTSILLAVLTTVLAIGALIFAKHPALLSIASVSLIGVFAAVIISFVFYPLFFKITVVNRVSKGLSPITLRLLILSVLFFVFYGIISLTVSIIGRLLFFGLPISSKKKQNLFSTLMSNYMKCIIYLSPYIKNKFDNPYQEDFKKPAVIIANHASFLDTLLIGMRVPKIIFFVNDWVWNSPVFGRIVRAAGFYPTSLGIENGAELLKDKIAMGYSIVVFPEGTRSYNNSIQRFHKGAFYLAQQLKLDILPFYIHGNSEVLPKGDFIVYDGKLSTTVGKRIKYNDDIFGETYKERTKLVSKHFKMEFNQLRNRLENENYFKKKLLWSYLYKEEDIIKAVTTDFNINKGIYHQLNSFFSPKDKFVHWADNYGQIDFILALQQANRKIYSVIFDHDKRTVAKSNYLRANRYISFLENEPEGITKLLISKQMTADSVEINKLALFTDIVVIHNAVLHQELYKLGFQIKFQKDSIIHFVKN